MPVVLISTFISLFCGLHRGPSGGSHHHPQNPLLVFEDIFSVIFVVAGLMMLVLQFGQKLLTALTGLAYASISEEKPDWIALREVVLHAIIRLRSWATDPPFEPPRK